MNKEDNIRTSKAAVIIVLYQPQKTDIDKVSLMADRYAGVIIDNSQENTFKQENVGLMHYIPLHENKGIAEAQNIGLQYIFNHTDATHIVFLDQDSDVPATYVDDIVAAFNQIRQEFPNLAFLGPKAENKATGKEYKSVFHKDKTAAPNFILKREVISSGGCTTREVMESVGMNESGLFIDYVDLEWCWRAESKGFICGITPEITIRHMVGQDTIYIGGYTIIVSSPKRYFYQLRNYIWLLPRKYVPRQWKINKGIKNVARLIYFPFLIKSGFSCWKYMMKGIYAGLTQKK